MTSHAPITLTVLLILAASSTAVRAEGNSDWELSGYQKQTVDVALATNKKTGHKMHVLKLKDGTVMAIVPASPLWAMMKDNALSDIGN